MRVAAWIVILLTVFVVAYQFGGAEGNIRVFLAFNLFNPLLLILLPAAAIGAVLLSRPPD
jgi:hypothetical protein